MDKNTAMPTLLKTLHARSVPNLLLATAAHSSCSRPIPVAPSACLPDPQVQTIQQDRTQD